MRTPAGPIRAELFSAERLEEFAGALAAEQPIRSGKRRGRPLLRRLSENARVLLASHRVIEQASREAHAISPAAEWLLNNFHVVEEQIREIGEDLPPGFYRELPKLSSGPLAGYPRVYGLAWEYVAHTDSRIDLETLARFVRAYQRVQPLTIGELWALAISLRLVLVENLRRLAEGVAARGTARERADVIADAQLGTTGQPKPERAAMIQMLELQPFTEAFAVQLAQRLREQDPALTPALHWLEERLARDGKTAEQAVHDEQQNQVGSHATVRNVITSMRLLSSADWSEFFESVSLVHAALCDGTRVAEMDFATRDRYRHAIEALARGSGQDERSVAQHATTLAREAAEGDPGDARLADPGYYLISKGRPRLEAALGFRPSVGQRLRRAAFRIHTPLYLGSIAAATLAILAVPLVLSSARGVSRDGLLLFAILALVPASDLASALVQRVVTQLVPPHRLPKLELAQGVPETARALVSIPMLLTDEAEVKDAVERLEVHYLADPDPELRFALLSDWSDAASETLPEDEALLATARAGVAELNRRYGDRFWVLHRRRLWNAGEGVWMGWERKRGKLRELNRLLRGASDTSFLPLPDGAPALSGVRYVITLDADTRLPRESARRLIGTISHPLNLPVFDTSAGRVVDGHAILQPRVTPTLPETGFGTLFQLVFSGPRGIDQYAFAVSDVYQDLFGEGIYTGKGIYDVDAFERALSDRVPENTQLSHDLFEGIFARAGFVSDVEVFEGFPGHYEVAASRQHRWVRGDWQLLPWIFGNGPRGTPNRGATPLMGRWKMADNLRRSLSAPTSLATLVAGWCVAGGAAAGVWTLFIPVVLSLMTFLSFFTNLLPERRGVAKRSFLKGIVADLGIGLSQSALRAVLLAHAAWSRVDAIGRTVWRLAVTRRHLLEWVPAAQAHRAFDLRAEGFFRRMWSADGVGLAAAVLVAASESRSWILAVPFLGLWIASPLVARWISLPPRDTAATQLSPDQTRRLRRIARRTWRYFEQFLGPESHHLPADNFQETPRPETARRTSPTNIGLALLSTVAANDLGWIGTGEMLERLDATLTTLQALERYRGHFYNWYDTNHLAPLEPRYVSTVDSGNLAAHLIVLRHACLERLEEPVQIERALGGIGDTLGLLREAAIGVAGRSQGRVVTRRHLELVLEDAEALFTPVPASHEEWKQRLAALTAQAETLMDAVRALQQEDPSAAAAAAQWARSLQSCVASHARDAAAVEGSEDVAEVFSRRLSGIASTAAGLADEMDFTFLYDRPRGLFSIGCRRSDEALDSGHYDLLASEARLTSFVAIARGFVPVEHWFHLGRPLTPAGRGSVLLSWSGSMFEYLMADLVLDPPSGSLLDQTNRLAVQRQIRYGEERGVPWGISESAYNARDVHFTYQYSSFGVSGLGLKRGLGDDLVVAPYATGLAAMVDPAAALENFERMAALGALGDWGFYESIDYTPTRVPEGQPYAIVRAYMAHHQGMTIIALTNLLLEWTMRRRFEADPIVQATDLLLQERTPRTVTVSRPLSAEARRPNVRDGAPPVLRRFRSPHDPTPRTHLLSNGRYSVMMTAAGSGYSRWRGLDVTRWREDSTRDGWGTYVFLTDGETGETWSAGYQPAGVEPDSYEAVYAEDHVEIHRRDGSIETSLTILVSTADDAEVRQISLTNYGTRVREIELTSYAEIVLATAADDAAHPAFSNLFVQTEFVPGVEALLASRRPRNDEESVWAAHVMVVPGEVAGTLQFETDRARFLGRGRGIRHPSAIEERRPLSNTVGAVVDPIFSIRRRLRLAPGETARVHLALIAADSREGALAAADKYRDPATFDRVASLAWTQAQVQLRHMGITIDEAHLFQRLATRILYSDPTLRAPAATLLRNRRGASALWRHGISGDRPIVLVRIDQVDDQAIVRQLLLAHEYWRLKGLGVDLVIINEEPTSYSPELMSALESLVRAGTRAFGSADESTVGEVFVLRGELLSAEERDALATAARVVLLSRQGTLAEQVIRLLKRTPARRAARAVLPGPSASAVPPPRIPLDFFNGLGGFSKDGDEYVTILGEGQWTPAPWINVLANARLGCLVSESGSAYTWAGNSRLNQLTPWSNDPVSDPPGEALFLRDEENGELWCPTPLPIRNDESYVIRHAPGYSRFEHEHRGIATDLLVFVPPEDPVKIAVLGLENRSGRPRSLSVTGYAEWVLGAQRETAAPFIVTELDPSGALFARNSWNESYPSRVAFADLGPGDLAWTADRTDFLGRNLGLDAPAGLAPGAILSRRAGGGMDPCAALQRPIHLEPGQRAQIVFLIGEGSDVEEARQLVRRYRTVDLGASLQAVRGEWRDSLTALQVRTPDASMDLLLNRWLLYQVISCRYLARSAFYQAGGAWGFRDQLQDAMSFTVARRELTRAHLLRAAARQFEEGDVQHWWHEPDGKGVRTRISDDLLWLPYATRHYVDVTGDDGILDEEAPFLSAAPLSEGETDRYFEPEVSAQRASLFEHCARALDRSLGVGPHGLPLMGSGDWNDGMNRVGIGGKGESVWLGWFLLANLEPFAEIAERRGEDARARAWRTHALALKAALEQDGWDGDWYRRAFFDDGTPLGSASNDECRIDSIAQSWGVLSGAADPERARRAMAAVDEHLIRRGDGLVLLFTPPFDHTAMDPGYIKGYVPGVRENGGQYTHAAVWALIAFAALGDGDKAGELFAILNPINHASTRSGLYRYKVEPYVMAGDVYSTAPHTGRGGWTWYTGAAGWMYRAGIESILGFRLRGTTLQVDPCIPRVWPQFEIAFRYHSSSYRLAVENPHGVMRGVARITIDGQPLEGRDIPLADDGLEHRIAVVLG